jgi:hypothetical protein
VFTQGDDDQYVEQWEDECSSQEEGENGDVYSVQRDAVYMYNTVRPAYDPEDDDGLFATDGGVPYRTSSAPQRTTRRAQSPLMGVDPPRSNQHTTGLSPYGAYQID